jgi:hypothetical protein
VLTRLALVIAPLSLTACATEAFDTAACPVPVAYGAAVMLQAARELVLLPDPSVLGDRFVPDYARLRAQSMACLAGTARDG